MKVWQVYGRRIKLIIILIPVAERNWIELKFYWNDGQRLQPRNCEPELGTGHSAQIGTFHSPNVTWTLDSRDDKLSLCSEDSFLIYEDCLCTEDRQRLLHYQRNKEVFSPTIAKNLIVKMYSSRGVASQWRGGQCNKVGFCMMPADIKNTALAVNLIIVLPSWVVSLSTPDCTCVSWCPEPGVVNMCICVGENFTL